MQDTIGPNVRPRTMSQLWVHIGVCWRIGLNHPCAAAVWGLLSNYDDHLFDTATDTVTDSINLDREGNVLQDDLSS